MSGRELLGIIFRVCRELRVSDIQMRASRPVYIHTNKGMEKLEFLGILSAANMDEILKELIANRESGSHGFGQDQAHGPAGRRENPPRHRRVRRNAAWRTSPATASRWATTANAPAASGSRPTSAPPASASPAGSSTISSPNSNPSASIPTPPTPSATASSSAPASASSPAPPAPANPPPSPRSSTGRAATIPNTSSPSRIPSSINIPMTWMIRNIRATASPRPASSPSRKSAGTSTPTARDSRTSCARPHTSFCSGKSATARRWKPAWKPPRPATSSSPPSTPPAPSRPSAGSSNSIRRENHTAVLSRLAEILIFIHSQGLLNGVQRRVLTYEFLQNNDDAVASAIANYDGGARSLEDVIRRAGNIEWDTNLRRLLNQGLITPDTFINARMNRNDDEI